MKTRSSGFSLVELMIGVGLSTALIAVVSSLAVTSITSLQHTTHQSDVDALYLNTLQGVRNVVQLKLWLPTTGSLGECLAGKGISCGSFATSSNLAGDGNQNAMFGVAGRCGASVADASPTCFMNVSTTYQWNCSANACTALEVQITVQPYNANQTPSSELAARHGSFSLASTAFTAKGAIKMNCASAGTLPLMGLDYSNYSDTCAVTPVEAPCRNPASTYGAGASNCQATQVSPSCSSAYGYASLGLFGAQDTCLTGSISGTVPSGTGSPVIPTPVSPTPVPTDGGPAPVPTDGGGGDGGAPAPPPYVPPPTPVPTDGSFTPAPTDGSFTPAPTDGSFTPTPTDGAPAPTDGAPAPTDGAPAPMDGQPIITPDGTAMGCIGGESAQMCGLDGGGGGGDGDGGGGGGGGDGDGDGGGG